MIFEMKLPDIGEGVAEGEVVRWMVAPGDAVQEHQPLAEVMTDKASVEIPSPRTGTIAKLHAEAGQILPVGAVLVSIEVAGAAGAPAAHPAPAAPAGATAPPATAAPAGARATAATTGARVAAAPAVRQLAKQLGVALERLAGSGPGGTITAEDVRRASGTATTATPAPAPAAGADERVPLRGLRRKIAEHMRHSLDTAAHFTFVAECDMSAVVGARNRLLPLARERGVQLTYLAFLVRALAETLGPYRWLNASLDDATSEIVLHAERNIGIATATDEGLTVPVIHHADRRTVLEIAAEIHRLALAARQGKLRLEELQGGTFTVTSTGARGGLLATPILHHPQVAILGVHEVKLRPVVVDGQIVAREMTNLSLSLDHRVVDGAVGADFLYALIGRLQTIDQWLTPEIVG